MRARREKLEWVCVGQGGEAGGRRREESEMDGATAGDRGRGRER